jgi:hypothetical protein
MLSNAHHFVRPADAAELAYLESFIRTDFERCHPGDTLDGIKRRAAFTKEDRRLYQDWMALAAQRARRAQITGQTATPSFDGLTMHITA